MADWRIPIEHLLVFAGEKEREFYLSPARTENERSHIRGELETVYLSIPDPTEAELKQFVGENTWKETAHNPSARLLPKAQWKSFRKADARNRLLVESTRQSSEPNKTLGGTDEMWWGHFYISHLDQKGRDRIKRGEFEPREIEMLAKGEDPWGEHYPVPPDVRPPASLPPFEQWIQSVVEHFSPAAERVRQAASDAAKQSGLQPESPAPPEPPPNDPLSYKRPHFGFSESDPKGETLGEYLLRSLPGRTAQEEYIDELRRFMPKPLLQEYENTGPERRDMLWDANERAFKEAERRRQEALKREGELTTKILDTLYRLSEDPSKAHLLPPDDASMDELREWYKEISRPQGRPDYGNPPDSKADEEDSPEPQPLQPKQETTRAEKFVLVLTGLGDVILAMIGGSQAKLWVSLVMLVIACLIQAAVIWKVRPFRSAMGNIGLAVGVMAVLGALWWGSRPDLPLPVEKKAQSQSDSALSDLPPKGYTRIYFYAMGASDGLVGAKVVIENEDTHQRITRSLDSTVTLDLPLEEGVYTFTITHAVLGTGVYRAVIRQKGEAIWALVEMSELTPPPKPTTSR
jgi:hypothetical protein